MNTSSTNQTIDIDSSSIYLYLQNIEAFSIKEHGDTIRVLVSRDKLRKTVEVLLKLDGIFLRTMMASDERSINGFFKLYYTFGVDRWHKNIVLEVPVPENNVVAPSLIDMIKAIDWYEREAYDLMGISFLGREHHKFVLPDDWPKDVYPLRKDYTSQELVKLYNPKIIEKVKEIGAEAAVIIPIGPYHPALHEPEYFELYVKGEQVIDAKYIGFMVHRGIEKLGESMKYDQIPFLAERICGICGFVHSTSYCQAVENALEIDIPERARYIRSIILEIERVHSHLLWLGVAFHILGYDTGFMHMWRIREQVMILAELLTGSRKTYGINIIGGVRRDIDDDKIKKCLAVLSSLEKEFKTLINLALSVPQIKTRLKDTGYLSKSDAQSLSLVGPTIRGSGIPRDVRRDYPYAAYRYVNFDIVVRSEGDNMARTEVRIEEIFQSISILRQLLDKIPRNSIAIESWEAEPNKLGIGSVEAPRGEVIHMIITGRFSPYRWRVRAPTYQNIPALPIMLKGSDLADAPITIASIDPCFSCTDRAIIINTRDNRIDVIPIQALSEKGSKMLR